MLKLIHKIARTEEALGKALILAPRPLGGKVRVRIDGLVREFVSDPADFEGWGLFTAASERHARLIEVASFSQISTYLERLRATRMILVSPRKGKCWKALPANRDEFSRRFRRSGPQALHLVERGRAFETVIARFDGANFWYDKVDRKADPTVPNKLGRALRAFTPAAEVRLPGLTPEMREAYRQIHAPTSPQDLARCSEARLRRALEQGGGVLESFTDCGDFWNTRWTTGDGETHVSAIAKNDLTVVSAGICLSGEDQKFDLASLVGVVERQQEW